MYKFILIALISVSFFACEKEVTDIKLPNAKPKLVLGCFLSSSDSLILVTVTKSVAIFSKGGSIDDYAVENASVTISNGTNVATLVFNSTTGNYQIETKFFPLIAGAEYTVSAKAQGYDDVSGKGVIPVSKISNGSAIIKAGQYGETDIRVNWMDIANEKNYYRIRVQYIAVKDSNALSSLKDTVYVYSIDSYIKTTFTDEGKDGQELSAQLDYFLGLGNNIYPYGFPSGNSPMSNKRYKIIGYLIEVLNVDYNYYQFQNSLYNFMSKGGDPFSEPSFVFTNVDKGLGVVGGYTRYSFIRN
ncbi:MAG: DUF4249 domain-containing protein [Bacteroidia bacterium]